MHDGDVLVIGEGAEQTALLGVGVGQQLQRGIRMRGHDHAIKAFFALWGRHDDLLAVAPDGGDALPEAEIGRVSLKHCLDVSP